MTAQLLKRLLAVALVAVAYLSFTGQILAGFATTNTDVNANGTSANTGLPTGPFLPGITTLSAGVNTRFYTNTFSINPLTGVADVRTVFAGSLAGVSDGDTFSPVNGPGAANTTIAILGAIEGTATATSSGNFVLNITSGGFGLFTNGTAPLNAVNPSSWPTGAPFATFVLGPKTDVVPGSPNTDLAASQNVSAVDMNQSSINSTNPGQSQGRIIFLNGVGADAFLLPGKPGAPQPPVGLFIHFGQSVETTSVLNLDGADLAALNAIQTANTGDIFATGLGGTATSDFTPKFSGGISTTGDFRAFGEGVQANPLAAVPEPASFALMGMGLASMVVFVRRRKNTVQA